MTDRQEKMFFGALIVISLEFIVYLITIIYCIISTINMQSNYQLSRPYQRETSMLSQIGAGEGLLLQDRASLECSKKELYEVEIVFFSSSYYFSGQLTEISENYYNPTETEREWTYLVVYAEAGNEEPFGQTLVANVIINRALRNNSDLITESLKDGQFSCIHNGVPCIYIKKEDKWIPVTEDMISDELREAVDLAFEKDYTEDLLKEVAEAKNLGENYYEGGALFFCNPKKISDYQASLRADIKVSFTYGNHMFYRDKH